MKSIPTLSGSPYLKAVLLKRNLSLAREVLRRKDAEILTKESNRQHQALLLESQIMQRKLRQLTRQVISAHEEERKEISRELHDEVVQTLIGINVQLAALSKGATDGLDTLKEKIAATQKLVANSVNAVHDFARELRPAGLDDLGLIPALHAYCKTLADRKNIRIHITTIGGVEILDSDQKTALYRVAQEALTNIVRHARASQVRITISTAANAIQMEIGDDGKAFQVGKTLSCNSSKRLGLLGMRERIEMVGGSLAITSAPERGTTVRATIPLPFVTGRR
jgi:signal transduction histidine kinase